MGCASPTSRIAKKSAPPIMPSSDIVRRSIAGINENTKYNKLLYSPSAKFSTIASTAAGAQVNSGMSLYFRSLYEAYISVSSVAHIIIVYGN